MSLALPLSGSPLRELFDVRDLLVPASLPTFRAALNGARSTIASDPAIASVNALVLRADGQIWLVKVGRRGGWRRLWNFSK